MYFKKLFEEKKYMSKKKNTKIQKFLAIMIIIYIYTLFFFNTIRYQKPRIDKLLWYNC